MPYRNLADSDYTDPRILVAPTLAALRAATIAGPTTTPSGPSVQTGSGSSWPTGGPHPLAVLLGATAAFDQALKVYGWDSASVAADNGTTIIQPGFGTGSALATGRWRSP